MAEVAPSILIVSSDEELSHSLRDLLTFSQPYEVRCESSPEYVLEILKADFFHLIIIDENIGDVSALAMAHEIRKLHVSKPELVILNSDARISLHECHQIGISEVLQKPIVLDDVHKVIQTAISTGRRFQRIQINSSNVGGMRGKVQVRGDDKNASIEVSNLGRGGFFYQVENGLYLPKVGQEIDFNLSLTMVPSYSFAGEGIIRWVRNTSDIGAGVEFLSIPEESEKLITAFVDLFRVSSYVPDKAT